MRGRSVFGGHGRTSSEAKFLGIERMRGRVEKVCHKAAKIGNVRVLHLETSYAVRYLLPENAVETFYLLFPDPWPKRRHQRRRVATSEFLDAIHRALRRRGVDVRTFAIRSATPRSSRSSRWRWR